MTRLEQAYNIIEELLNCCELNLDDMEPETVETISKAHGFLEEHKIK